ncbi:MAG TPA: phospholipase D-like domain-containing protein [Solirubrobacteraceae bacterium]|jgi:phosphatidylserine/phosphatidylglycerophosphate/cardiolipin synthase-like enzyme
MLALAAPLAAAALTRAATAGGRLALLVEPAAGIAPIYRLIASAHHSVQMTMYELADQTAEQALAADAARGVHVQVILDGSSYDRSLNQPAFDYLAAHRVAVRWAPREFDLTHEKAIVVDGARAVVMTLNLESRYYASTRDFALIDTQPADVRAIAATFAADWVARPIAPQSGSGDLLWSPGAQAAVLSLIASARQRLDVENEELDSAAVESALAAAARRGVKVRLVMTFSEDWERALHALAVAGVQERLYAASAPLYIHAKLIVVDGARAFIGSQNFSTASLEYNRELGVVTAEAPVLAGTEATFGADFAGGHAPTDE